ncbi:MAG: LytTR family transcriptional regulator [Clostridia bacterium]|nr:LytTR family transcriptional regulator [Clostridia bacterium]
MNINVTTNISKDHGEDIEVIINTSKITKELEDLINLINETSKGEINTILGKDDNKISIINVDEIMYIYSENQSNFCKTEKGTFKISEKLYDLESKLPRDKFIRISNSTIINIKYVDCFDVGIVGTILVKFIDKSTEYVSRRRVKDVMKFLKERR